MNKSNQKEPTTFVLIMGLLIFISLSIGAFVVCSIKQKRSNTKQAGTLSKIVAKPATSIAPTYQEQHYLTPTILSASQARWKTFVYPTGFYSFSFPASWNVQVTNATKFPYVRLTYTVDEQEYHMEFMPGGRGGPQYDYIKTGEVIYGGRKGKQYTYFRNNTPFESVVSFDDYQPGRDPFVGIDIQLPSTQTNQYLALFDQILSSLKFSSSQ